MKAADKFEGASRLDAPLFIAADMGRRERGKRDKFERIKRAARKLLSRNGFEGATTRAIAEAADIGVGTLFLYALTKEDLLILLFREEVGRAIDDAFASMPERPILDQMMHVFRAFIAHHRENPGLALVFVKELPFVDDSRHGVAEFMASLFKRMAALVDQAKSRGELKPDIASHPLADNLFALYFHQVQVWLGGKKTAKRCELDLRASLELHLSGLRNPPRRAARLLVDRR